MSKIKWKELQPEKVSWAEAILEVEGLVNAEISHLRKKVTITLLIYFLNQCM